MTGRGQSPEARGHFFHVTPSKADNKWRVREVKGDEIQAYSSRDEAIKEAERQAKNTSQGHVVIHSDDGKFQTIENF